MNSVRVLASLLLIPMLMHLLACKSEAPAPPKISKPMELLSQKSDMVELRTRARLHADRDSYEGYADASKLYSFVIQKKECDSLDRLNYLRCLMQQQWPDVKSDERYISLLQQSEKQISQVDSTSLDTVASRSFDYLQGLYQKRLGNHKASAEFLLKAANQGQSITQCWFQLGRAYEQVKDNASAMDAYNKALLVSPNSRASIYRLTRVLRALGNLKELAVQSKRMAALPNKKIKNHESCFLTEVQARHYDRKLGEIETSLTKFDELSPKSLENLKANSEQAYFLDANNDGKIDLALRADQGLSLYECVGAYEYREHKLAPLASQKLSSFASADTMNDHSVTLFCGLSDQLQIFRPKEGKPFDYALHSKVELGSECQQILTFDWDHDGDVDALVCTAQSVQLLRNNGDNSFKLLPAFASVPTGERSGFGDAHDLDQANDLDFVLPSSKGWIAGLNLRDGNFKAISIPGIEGCKSLCVEDLNNDGAPDLIAHDNESKLFVLLNSDLKGTREELSLAKPIEVDLSICGGISQLVLADVDADADLDVLVAGKAGLAYCLNKGGAIGQAKLGLSASLKSLATEDLNNDGILDILCLQEDGKLKILKASCSPRFTGFRVRPSGGKDNKASVGVVLEQFKMRSYQSMMMKNSYGSWIGTGASDPTTIDGLSLRWPQGIRQTLDASLIALNNERELRFKQKEGQVTSCPFLYTKNKSGWNFVSDVIGIAPLGEWAPPGESVPLDPEEYVRIDSSMLEAIDGKLQLCITEELRESTYLDRIELVVVDHPMDSELWLDESTRQGAYDDLSPFIFKTEDGLALPKENSKDKLSLLSKSDDSFYHPYGPAPSQWMGWVEPHDMELVAPAGATGLVLVGRIAWFDSSVAYSLHQNGRSWPAPQLIHVNASAQEKVLLENCGLPAGMDRSLVWTFPKMLAGEKIIVRSQFRCLWNEARFFSKMEQVTLEKELVNSSLGQIKVRRLQAERADLSFHGYSEMLGNRFLHEQAYVFANAEPSDRYEKATGWATRLGDVLPLVGEHDDLLVVLVAGDRLLLDFKDPGPPAAGYVRTYFAQISGWAKESGYHNRGGRDIEPMPLRSMKAYPPSKTRTDQQYLDYLNEYQTRLIK